MSAAVKKQSIYCTGVKRIDMNLVLPKEVAYIIHTLEEAGFEAYAVGGCVRDALLCKNPSDWDITTSATPEEVKHLFPVTIDTGIAHGTVTVRKNKKSFEVTTFRIDGKYTDARHPDDVSFTTEIAEDLRRRDFTVNAMAYNPKCGLIDLYEGRKDLKDGIIRCVGDPKERFTEDALRMMRAVRFCAQLGFVLEEKTKEAAKELAPRLQEVSVERIFTEFVKTICSEHPELIQLFFELSLTDVFFPEWNNMVATEQKTKHHRASVAGHTVYVMQGVPASLDLRLAALLHDVAKPICKKTDEEGNDHFTGHPQLGSDMAKDILRRWKADNKTIRTVSELVLFHDERPPVNKRNVRRMMHRVGVDLVPKLLLLRRADILGQSDYMRADKLQRIDDFETLYTEILKDNECVQLKDLAIGGKDLMDEGIAFGPQIGKTLAHLLELVINDPTYNQREDLLQKAKAFNGDKT